MTVKEERDDHSMKHSDNTDEREHGESKSSGNSSKSSKQQVSRYPYKKGTHAPYPMGRGSFGAPPPYGYPGHPGAAAYGHPLPPNYGYPGGPPPMPPYHHMGNRGSGPHHAMGFHHQGPIPPPSYRGQGMYGPPSSSFPGAPQYHHHSGIPIPSSYNSSDSVSSVSSKNSKKKRTIEGVHDESQLPASAYSFRRTDSTSSSTTATTVGNNTSSETYLTAEESPHKRDRSELPPLSMGSMSFEDDDRLTTDQLGREYHQRNFSVDASTASSLSVGGFSMNSYEARDPKASSKRHKVSEIDTLMVDSRVRPPSALEETEEPSRFEHLAIDPSKARSASSISTASVESKDRTLFMTLSTSPINSKNDVDQTPVSKNTKKEEKRKSSHHNEASAKSKPSDTPTPPAHDVSENMMIDDQGILNRHLRGHSFTPLPHLATSNGDDSTDDSPSHAAASAGIAPQLSWSIAGDSPSLGDLADWDEGENKSKSRPNSTTSSDSRKLLLSPNDFQMWREDHEDRAAGTTTPLPAFFGKDRNDNVKDDAVPNVPRSSTKSAMKMPSSWIKQQEHQVPPTPMYSSDYDAYARSPHHHDDYRRDSMDVYGAYPYGITTGPPDRIRNLRGRVVHPGMPPMPLHIHPGMPAHLPMTSPMGLGPKGNMWSPPGSIGHAMPSPHHMTSPLGSSSKRNCVPLKPPIPSRFQGDMEKVKCAPVPEFTSLVNFPAHISQKQSTNLPEGMRCCVMCGSACPCSTGGKGKKVIKPTKPGESGLVQRGSNGQSSAGDKAGGFAIIPTQNKGLCTLCDVNVWVVVNTGLEIKWCKGCKNFRPWAAFGEKGLATKCLRCRERQREKYALQKEQKEKARLMDKQKKESLSMR